MEIQNHHLDLAWMNNPALQRLLDVFKSSGHEIRLVGGAVRDSIIGRPVTDIDLATALLPQNVVKLLEAKKIKVLPIGIEHGTVMAVIDSHCFEITTLRRDLETDGRHAKVSFTDDWQQDASRRDFTMNALYLSSDGLILYDYFEGLKDLKARHIRFIGDAESRIQEDYLRVLRYFRFLSYFEDVEADSTILALFKKHEDALSQLSCERVHHEVFKMFAQKHMFLAYDAMLKTLPHFFSLLSNVSSLKSYLEKERACDAEGFRRFLFALNDKVDSQKIARHFVLSKKQRKRLEDFVLRKSNAQNSLDLDVVKRLLMFHNKDNVIDYLYLSNNCNLMYFLDFLDAFECPVFPVSGHDLKKEGFAEGVALGKALSLAKSWWIKQDFKPSKDDVINYVKQQN